MKNKTLNIIGICGTGLGIVIAWCVRCAMYFFHDHRPLNFLPVLLIQAAALALFLVMWRVKLPAWVSVVSLAAGGLGLVLSLVVAIVNLPNLPHFGNNLLEMLPVLVLGTAAAALYLLYDRLKASRAARFAALSIAGGVAAAAIGLTLPGYLTTGAVVFDTGGHLPCGGKIGFVYRQQPYLLRQHRARKADAVQDACFRGRRDLFYGFRHTCPARRRHSRGIGPIRPAGFYRMPRGLAVLREQPVRPIHAGGFHGRGQPGGSSRLCMSAETMSFWERKRNASRRISRRPTANFITHWHTTTPIF